jgi:hypothetical protein
LSESGLSYLAELLASAESEQDLRAIEELIAEQESRTAQAGRWRARTLAEVAQFFGVATQTVKQWRTETPPMPGTEGAWDLSEIVRWKMDRLSGLTARSAKAMQDLERGKVKLQAEQLELEQLKASLVERADVEEWATIVLTETRNLFMQIPGAVSAVCAVHDREPVHEQAELLVRETLQCLYDRLSQYAATQSH